MSLIFNELFFVVIFCCWDEIDIVTFCLFVSKDVCNATASLSITVPTRWTVPDASASGRSVVSRITSTGFPSPGASSWIPPESVKTMVALLIRYTNSRYWSGSIKKKLGRVRSSPNTSWMGLRTLGLRCIGYTKSTSRYFSERSFIVVTIRMKPSPKFSRRWPVMRTSFLLLARRVTS